MRFFLPANATHDLAEPTSFFMEISKKALGIAFIGLFTIYPAGTLFDLSYMWIGFFNPILSGVVWFLLDMTVCVSTFFAAKDKSLFNNSFGQIAAYSAIAIYAISATSLIIGALTDFYIFSFLGSYASLVLTLITAAIVITYLFSTKSSLPIMILGSITFALKIIASFVIALMNEAWKSTIGKDYGELDYSAFEQLSISFQICNCLAAACSIAALILVIIWLNKPDTAPSARQNPIELI